MDKNFDYAAAMAALEEIAAKVEDPSTALDEIDKYLERADKLVSQCREYLRSSRSKIDNLDK